MEPKLAFVHIPKTAGTAFRLAAIASIGRANVFVIGEDCTPEEWPTIPTEVVSGKRALMGHSKPELFRRLGPVRFATLVRDPIARAVSYFNFMVTRRPTSKLGALLVGKSLAEAARDVQAFREEVGDVQCRAICGAPSAAKALAEADGGDWLIDLDENAQRFADEVFGLFGWPSAVLIRANVGRPAYAEDLVTPEATLLLEQLNQQDLELFEAVRSRSR